MEMLFQRFWPKVKNNDGYKVTMKQQESTQETRHSRVGGSLMSATFEKNKCYPEYVFFPLSVSLLWPSGWARCISAGGSDDYPVFYLFANETPYS